MNQLDTDQTVRSQIARICNDLCITNGPCAKVQDAPQEINVLPGNLNLYSVNLGKGILKL